MAPPTETQKRAALVVGSTLAERYQLVRQVGQGAAGSRVYEAIDTQHGCTRLALKLLSDAEPQEIYRLKNEFRSLAELIHPNLVGLHALGSDGPRWFVAMDLVVGQDFLSYVRPPPSSELDLARLRDALAQLAVGIGAIHATGKMHRDLKPSNVLVREDGRVVIVDFGLVSTQSPGGVGRTRDNWFAGTPEYAAPEQVRDEQFDAKADLYAVGVMLYQALTGDVPFTGSADRVLRDKLERDPAPLEPAAALPADLCSLCQALLARDPAARPDADAMLRRLGAAPRTLPRAVLETRPFVGRRGELAGLLTAFEQADRQTAVLALVHGASGIGKSTLIEHFADSVQRTHHALVLHGRCYAREHVPYRAFDAIMDQLGRYLSRLSEPEAASLMPRDAAMIARIFPTLGRVPAIQRMPLRSQQAREDAAVRHLAYAALKELLARIADRRPLLLLLDDVQWDDADSSLLLRELLSGPDAPTALFVCVCRDEELGVSQILRSLRLITAPLHTLRVPSLSDAESELLMRELLSGADVDRRAEQLAHEACGSPLLICELARGLRRDGQRREFREVLAERLEELDDDCLHLLELVFNARDPLDVASALRASGASPRALSTLLAWSLLRLRLVEGREQIESYHQRWQELFSERRTPPKVCSRSR